MPLDVGATVLRCTRCNKPFDKETTLKRHGYYCRSRNAPPASRVRSCTACAKSKARCDSVRPICSRCSARGVDCQYPGRARGRSSQHAGIDTAPTPSWSTVVESETDSPDNGLFATSSAVDIDPWNIDWNNSPVDLTSLLDVESFSASTVPIKDMFTYPSPSSLPWNQLPTSTPSPYQAFTQPSTTSNNIILTPQPSPSTRSLVTRSRPAPGASGISKLILATLKSYPLMLLRHNTLPPFIHPRWLSGPASAHAQIEPLTNCVSLMHMLSSGLGSSRKLFWRNVRLECEQLREGRRALGMRGLLAGMQALSVYILVRVGEGETEHNNVDALLVGTVAALSREFAARYAPGADQMIAAGAPSSLSSADAPVLAGAMAAADAGAVNDHDYHDGHIGVDGSPDARWDAWIFEESKRRLCIVYQVVNLLVYFEPAALCGLQTEYVLAPLPQRRQLWEAQDHASWAAAEALEKPRVDYALAADGELVEVDARAIYRGTGTGHPTMEREGRAGRKVAKWEDWCAGMDSLGGLIMLAGSLVAS